MLSSLPSVVKTAASWCAGVTSTVLELAGCTALTTAAYMTDHRLGLLVGGLLAICVALLMDLSPGKRKP